MVRRLHSSTFCDLLDFLSDQQASKVHWICIVWVAKIRWTPLVSCFDSQCQLSYLRYLALSLNLFVCWNWMVSMCETLETKSLTQAIINNYYASEHTSLLPCVHKCVYDEHSISFSIRKWISHSIGIKINNINALNKSNRIFLAWLKLWNEWKHKQVGILKAIDSNWIENGSNTDK